MLQISEGRDDKHNVAGGVFSFEFGGCDPVDKGGSIPSLVLGEALTHSERGLDANSRYLGICIELGLLPAVWSSVIGARGEEIGTIPNRRRRGKYVLRPCLLLLMLPVVSTLLREYKEHTLRFPIIHSKSFVVVPDTVWKTIACV